MNTIEAKPYQYKYDLKKTAIVMVNFEKDFMLGDGFEETLGNDASLLRTAIEPAQKVLEAGREYELTVFHLRECHRPDLSDLHNNKYKRGNPTSRIGERGPMGKILISGEEGVEIIDELKPIHGESIIDKPRKGPFYRTTFEEELRKKGIEYAIICGVTTEVCVHSVTSEMNDRGFEPLVISDAVASYKPKLHEAALEMIVSQNGIRGWTATSEQFVKSLKQYK